MKKLCLLIFIILIGFSVKSQPKFTLTHHWEESISQLKTELTSAKTDSDKLSLLHALILTGPNINYALQIDSTVLLKIISINQKTKLLDNAPYQTLLLASRSKQLPELLGLLTRAVDDFDRQSIEVPELLIGMRVLYNMTNTQDAKYSYYTQKLSYYQQHNNNASLSACYHGLGGYYVYKGDYNTAISYYLKAAEHFKHISNTWYCNEILVIGGIYLEWGNMDKALYYLKSIFNFQNKNHSDNLNAALLDLGRLEYQRKNYQASINYLNENGPYKKYWVKEPGNLTFTYITLALDYIALGRPEKALPLLNYSKKYEQILQIQLSGGSGRFEIDYAFYKYYQAIHQPQQALAALLTAYQKAVEVGDLQIRLKYTRELAGFYGSSDAAKAWTYTQLYHHLNDSLTLKTDKYKIAAYETELKEKAQNQKLDSLKQERAIQDATLNQRNRIIWISLTGLLAVCLSLVFIYRQLQLNKRTLSQLQQTQNQLIQSEKMASLGELTAGIAHEIQNPLNFVNNFAEVSNELLDEMEEELTKGDIAEAVTIAGDIKQNLDKIRHHGRRADGIVKSMLQHSRMGNTTKELTNINTLADEYMRLAYHGLRAKDKSFNADLVTNFSPGVPVINIVAQDIGRVLLNLLTNAFYATHQKQKTAGADYKPTVTVTTVLVDKNIRVSVKDNGTGIPDAIKEKIMQPFFTTKPTGEGTGLGLSLSYDIIVKAHNGKIEVESKQGEYTELTITIPA